MTIFIFIVAGDWQPQDYGQNPVRPPIVTPGPSLDQKPVLSQTFAGQPTNMPQARPCRRRNFDNPAVVFTDSGWVPLPFAQPPISQQTGIQPVQPQFKPQSLTENMAPNVKNDKKQEAEQKDTKTRYPDKLVGFVEKSSHSNQNSGHRYREDNENKKVTSDHTLNTVFSDKTNAPKTGQDSGLAMTDKKDHDHNSSDGVDSHEESLECGRDGEVDAEARSGNSETKDVVSKSAPGEVYDQAEKLFSKCVHESRRSMSDLESDLRSYEPDSPAELDKTDFEISSKTEPQANIQRTKAVVIPSKNVINKYEAKEYLQNPAKNAGKWHSGRQVSLLENGKVCYACSSYYDPSCWRTNATTTVKFCNRDNNACLTKMYKIEGKSILIRDCGHTCNEDEGYNIGQKMTSCSICQHDMCNSANAMHGLHALLVVFVMYTLKFTLQ